MIALHGLRILGDLAFYYAFAGFFSGRLRRASHNLGASLARFLFCGGDLFPGKSHPAHRAGAGQCGGAAVSACTGGSARLSPGGVLCDAAGGAGRVRPFLQCSRGKRFRWLLRIWPLFGAAMLLWNADAVLTTALPMAITAALALVWFTRTTRQDPEVYSAPSYLLISGGLLAALSGAAFLLSRSAVMNGVKLWPQRCISSCWCRCCNWC